MYYLNDFIRIRSELEKRKELLESELAELPAGSLYCYTVKGQPFYSERIPANGKSRKEKRVGVKRDKDRLYQLVRKQYVEKAINSIDGDLNALNTLLNGYRPSDENSIMAGFLEKHPELAEGIYYGQVRHDEWASSFSSDNAFHDENLKSTSSDGTKRRSLAEIVIGTKLDQYGIPYRYEAPIGHPDIPFIPDFTIKRPRDEKIIYWEHLGMVNDREYLNHNKSKFDLYERYGIVPWDNLIVSYSQADYGINEKLIDGLIQGWLL